MTDQTHTTQEPKPAAPHAAVKFTLAEVPTGAVSIKVIGIGGCGGNVVDHMIDAGVAGVDFSCVNTDEQALKSCTAPTKILLGQRVTQGYGTGSDPDVGREAALENTEELTELLGDADMVFLCVGLGGGTGTGAGPVIASLAKQMGALTIAAAIMPFGFEGKRRCRQAEAGMEALIEQVDTAIPVPNEQMLGQLEPGSGFFDAFERANRSTLRILNGINDVILKPGIMNADFADVRAVLSDAGMAVVGSAQSDSRDAAVQAARDALACPKVSGQDISRASKVLVNITGSAHFGIQDASEALLLIQREIASEANLIIGTVCDESMGESVRVMIVASGFSEASFRLEAPVESPIVAEAPVPSASPWQDETAVELLETEVTEIPPEVGLEADAPPVSADPAEPPATNGYPEPEHKPLEFMPPPKIRDESTEIETDRPSFFRRHSIFR